MTVFLVYIGHGRALELFLGVLKTAIAISIAMSDLDVRIAPLSDLTWFYPSYMIAAPFFLIGVLQAGGILLNMCGYTSSWVLRFTAALLAMFMWSALLFKSSIVGLPTLIAPLAISCLPASAFLLYKSWNRLPVAGAAGLV